MSPMIMMNLIKTCGVWFSQRQLGLANGAIAMGMALGFVVSSMISATLVSPWLGGWRNVLFLYGAIAVCISVPWYLSRPAPNPVEGPAGETTSMGLLQTVSHVARSRDVWLLGLAILGIGSCVQGTLGYLPLYLRGLGWSDAAADGALATFHAASLTFVLPIALWSDRLGSRRTVLMITALMIVTGIGLLSFAGGMMVWVAVVMAGLVRDGFMGVFTTAILEIEGVGAVYASTAMGLVMVFSGLGRLVAPPLGNSLADIAPSLPFAFWAALAAVGCLGLWLVKGRVEDKALATT